MRGRILLLAKDDTYDPPTSVSRNWKHWKAELGPKTCEDCKGMHGKIWAREETPNPVPPLHPNCRCVIEAMRAVAVGVATKDGQGGADWWLKHNGALPLYYITKNEIFDLGWENGKAPAKHAPGKMLTMGIYRNKNGHLPDAPGRIWYEADINYYSGRRNAHRVLWSNDGLIFVTYDHYTTFMEVA